MAIQVFRSDQSGAPTLSGQAGALITLLDTCLVDGYATASVTSITRSSATATVTTGAAHGYATNDWVTISGATESDYNGKYKITVTGSTTFTYTVANSPTTPATGTILHRRAAAGFTKTFSGTNKAVYRSSDGSGNQLYFRVDDAGGTSGGALEARFRGYETMSDVDTGTNPFPTVAQNVNGWFVYKSQTANSTARPWVLITDGKTVYFFNCGDATGLTAPTGNYHYGFVFGDIISFKASDAYSSILGGMTASNAPTSPQQAWVAPIVGSSSTLSPATSHGSQGLSVCRDYTATQLSTYAQVYGTGIVTGTMGSSAPISFPHRPDNGFYIAPVLLCQSLTSVASSTHFRGRMPGLYEPLHGRALSAWDTLTNIQGLSGRTLMFLYVTNGSTAGSVMIDLTGNSDAWD